MPTIAHHPRRRFNRLLLLCGLAIGFTHSAAASEPPTPLELAYGTHDRQRLDLFAVGDQTPRPVAVFFHGGAFAKGDKSRVRKGTNLATLQKLLARNINVVSVNYRYSTDSPYPAPMHDAARAVQFLRLHASEYGLDPERFAAWGESAGGGIALWLATHDDLADPHADDALRRQSTRLVGAVGILAQATYDPGATNRLFPGIAAEQSNMYLKLFGQPDADAMRRPAMQPIYDDASPLTQLTADDPPLFLVYKNDPPDVPADAPLNTWVHHRRHGDALLAAAQPLGVACSLQIGPRIQTTTGSPSSPDYGAFLLNVLQHTPRPPSLGLSRRQR